MLQADGRLLLIVATPPEMKTYLAQNVNSDLLFLWSKSELSLEHQYKRSQKKVTTMSRFPSLEYDREKRKNLMIQGAVVLGVIVGMGIGAGTQQGRD